jgi:hypothetical protein
MTALSSSARSALGDEVAESCRAEADSISFDEAISIALGVHPVGSDAHRR